MLYVNMGKGWLVIICMIFILIGENAVSTTIPHENASQLPDLTIYYVHINTTSFVVSAGVQNLGGENVNVSIGFYDSFLLLGILPINERRFSTVEPLFITEYGGAEIAVVWDSPWLEHPILKHRITVIADPDNLIEESDETNNARSVDVHIPIW